MRDLFSNIGAVATLAAAVHAATLKGTAVDLHGFNSAALVINTGAIAGDGLYDVKLQESDTTTDGDFTDVVTTDLLGTLPAALAASATYRQGYVGHKRYVRAIITKQSGTSIAASAMVVKGHPQRAPTSA